MRGVWGAGTSAAMAVLVALVASCTTGLKLTNLTLPSPSPGDHAGLPASGSIPATGLTNVAPLANLPVTGLVIGQDGKPAVGVTVTAYLTNADPLVGNSGSGLIGNSGSGLVGNSGSGLIGNSGSGLVGNNSGAYRVESLYRTQAIGSVQTDAQGQFTLTPSATGVLNLEAVQNASSKAMLQQVIYASTSSIVQAGQMALQPTGVISGKVTAPDAPTVTDLEGIDVYVPGTSYVAKTDPSGNFTISSVAAGTFDLTAEQTGLGEAHEQNVVVQPKQTTVAPDLRLSLKSPSIASVTPANGPPGTVVTLRGANFGASQGKTFSLQFPGAPATVMQRVDDSTLTATVPQGATTGQLVLTVDGIPSNGFYFQVTSSFNFAGGGAVLVGKQLLLSLTASDSAGKPVADPVFSWAFSGSAATASTDATSSLITGLSPGTFTVSVVAGGASSSVSVDVFKILGVSLDQTAVTLDAMPGDGSQPDPSFVVSATLSATVNASDHAGRAVTWASSDPTLVSVNAQGGLQSGRVVTPGTAIVTATSVDDPSVFATASVTVNVNGGLAVGVN